MFTDRPPKSARLQTEYLNSDQLCRLDLLGYDRLLTRARRIEESMTGERPAPVRTACSEFVGAGGGVLLCSNSADLHDSGTAPTLFWRALAAEAGQSTGSEPISAYGDRL